MSEVLINFKWKDTRIEATAVDLEARNAALERAREEKQETERALRRAHEGTDEQANLWLEIEAQERSEDK